MIVDNFSFFELEKSLKEKNPQIRKYNKRNGSLYFVDDHRTHISISLEGFYDDISKFVPSGTSNIKIDHSYCGNIDNKVIDTNIEIAVHGFNLTSFIISRLYDNKSDITYDEFMELCKINNWERRITEYSDPNNHTYIIPTSKNHCLTFTIKMDRNSPRSIVTHYSKSGSASWYNILNSRINYDNSIYMCGNIYVTYGIKLIMIYDILSELNRNVIDGYVPIRPTRKQCNNKFDYDYSE